jgi:hypothetical protein
MNFYECPYIILVSGSEKIYDGRFYASFAEAKSVGENLVKDRGYGVYIFRAKEYLMPEKNPIKVITYG